MVAGRALEWRPLRLLLHLVLAAALLLPGAGKRQILLGWGRWGKRDAGAADRDGLGAAGMEEPEAGEQRGLAKVPATSSCELPLDASEKARFPLLCVVAEFVDVSEEGDGDGTKLGWGSCSRGDTVRMLCRVRRSSRISWVL